MAAELAARGPFEMLTRTFRATRMDKKKEMNRELLRTFIFSSKDSLELGGRNTKEHPGTVF